MGKITYAVIALGVAVMFFSGSARSDSGLVDASAADCDRGSDLDLKAGLLIDGITAQEGSGPVEARSEAPRGQKSVLRGMLFSALVPGLGEIYANGTRGYVTGGIMAAADIFASWQYFSNNSKGDDRKGDYERFAMEHYDADSLETYVVTVVARWSGSPDLQHCIPGPTYDNQLCLGEFAESFPLGATGSDDYYQQIGNDDRYVMGWDDWDPYQVLNHEVLWTSWNPGDPIPPGLPSTTANRETYNGMRDDANDFFSKADNYAWVMVIGRVVSMIDTAILVKLRNKDLAGLGTNPRLCFEVRSVAKPDFRLALKARF